MPHTDLDLK